MATPAGSFISVLMQFTLHHGFKPVTILALSDFLFVFVQIWIRLRSGSVTVGELEQC